MDDVARITTPVEKWAAQVLLPHRTLEDRQVGPIAVAHALRDLAALVERDMAGRHVLWDTLKMEYMTAARVGDSLPLYAADMLRLTVESAMVRHDGLKVE